MGSAAATADRIVAGDYVPTDLQIRGGIEDMRTHLADRSLPVIVADNVAAYVLEQGAKGRAFEIGSWPCLAPPWEWAFIEYPNATGHQRRGAYMIGFDLWRATPDELGELNGLVGGAIEDARKQSPGEDVRWALVIVMLIDDGHKVQGPMGGIVWALDEHGKELGNRWFLRPESKWTPANQDEAEWLHAAALPALQAIAFMHCKNVVMDRQSRPHKLARAYRRRHGNDPLMWQTVRLELPRQYQDPDQAKGPGTAPSLHIVTGHFSHYGNCCPTQHEPKGKLFGRLEGIYWMPQHMRGDPSREVRSDRVVTLASVSDTALVPTDRPIGPVGDAR